MADTGSAVLEKEINETSAEQSPNLEYITAEEAIKKFIRPGSRIWEQEAAAAPKELTEALRLIVAKDQLELPADEITEEILGTGNPNAVHLIALHTEEPATYAKLLRDEEGNITPEAYHVLGAIKHEALFIAGNVRKEVQQGITATYTAANLGNIPRLLERGSLQVDRAFIMVSPPDKNGNCSLGTSLACTRTVLDLAIAQKEAVMDGTQIKNPIKIIAVVNEKVPHLGGDALINTKYLDAVVRSDRDLPEHKSELPSDIETAIGKHVAQLIEDDSTLQIGIGPIPDACLMQLFNKKNLHVFTEMFSNYLAKLAEAGVITGDLITSFINGDGECWNWVRKNLHRIKMKATKFTNDPENIKKNKKMISVNGAMQVDITGQVCADSIGAKIFSGPGGQNDYVEGATRSEGGKSILVLPSEAHIDTGNGVRKWISRIVPFLKEGAGVVTSRNVVQWIATEFGAVNLEGRSQEERALLLIAISHPDHWDELIQVSKDRNLFERPGIVTADYIKRIRDGEVKDRNGKICVVRDTTVDLEKLRKHPE